MEAQKKCAYCSKTFEKMAKPFVPVNSNDPYHWKCYMKYLKERRMGDDIFDEVPEKVEIQQP